MGYTTVRHETGEYQNFQPDNDENTLYIESDYGGINLKKIKKKIRKHFGTDDLSLFNIEAKHINTRCIGGRYDSGDYDNFLVITKNPPAENNS